MSSSQNPLTDDQRLFAHDKALQDLAEAARSVEEAREQERQKLARELHDRVLQPLVVLVATMDVLSPQPPITGLPTDWMPTSRDLAHEALDALRDVVAGLHTHPYETQSLASALRQYLVPPFQNRGVHVTVESHDWPDHLPPEWAFHLYLAVREAVVNAEKHGHASEVHVLLRADTKQLDLVISDNGTGFQLGSPARADLDRSGHGLGIGNMRDRARLLGGEFTLDSAPGRGVQVTITIPRSLLSGNTASSRPTMSPN